MKTAIKRKTKPPATFEEEYRSAFGEYARSGGEAALGRAYELGRRAITEKKSQVEKQLRRYSHELRPTVLDDLGWIPAIRFLAEGVSKRANLPIHIKVAFAGRLPSTTEIALYRVVQEALTNAVKHAKASNIWVRAWRDDFVLCCSIRDDGAGFDVHAVQSDCKRRGLGLTGMRERVSAIGGTVRIESRRGQGTELLIRRPLEDAYANSLAVRLDGVNVK